MRRVAARHRSAHTLAIDISLHSEAELDQRQKEIVALEQDWAQNPRWKGVKRGYSAEDVVCLGGSVTIEHTLANAGAEKLWMLCRERPFVNSLGALTGHQAMREWRAGVPASYLSGWQGVAQANDPLSLD